MCLHGLLNVSVPKDGAKHNYKKPSHQKSRMKSTFSVQRAFICIFQACWDLFKAFLINTDNPTASFPNPPHSYF